jgi:LSD1 subclass zinc finger protein
MTPRLVQASCPRCGASLPITPGATQVACAYCGTVSFVQPPKRATGVYVPPTPPGQPIIQLDARQWSDLGGTIAKATMWVTLIMVLAPAIFVVGILGYVFWTIHRAFDSATHSPPKSPVSTPTPTPPTKAKASADDEPETAFDFPSLSGCTCKAKVDGVQSYVTLSAQLRESTDDYIAIFELAAPGNRHFVLATGDETAPPSHVSGKMLGLAVACHEDMVAIVAGSRVTGWSAKTGKAVWNTKLPGAYIQPGKAPKDGFTIHCAHAEREDPDVTVGTERGDVTVRLKDGKIVK